jgi:MFS family permease
MVYFMNAFQQSITGNLTPYVLSGFESHSLIPVIGIVANVLPGACRLAVAKMLDLWGRPYGFAVMCSVAILGLILMATSHSVETYAAAQVFYSVGFDGLIYTCDVVTSDSSSLINRGLAFAFTSSPYIITAFAGPKAAEGFYVDINWRWGFGIFCILLPVVSAPLLITLIVNLKKAIIAGVLPRQRSGRTLRQSIWHYAIEFDGMYFLLVIQLLLIDN